MPITTLHFLILVAVIALLAGVPIVITRMVIAHRERTGKIERGIDPNEPTGKNAR